MRAGDPARARVLAVDDEAMILEPVKAYLEQQGYAVSTAENGAGALALVAKGGVDIVLLDLMLPDMPGEEVCRRIREGSGVPVIMLTAKAAEESEIEGLAAGADDYVTKPFGLGALAARIEAVLRRLPERGALAAFPDAGLTMTERRLAGALSRSPGRVFTRDELIDVAFGDAFDGYDRVIDTHIKNLRKKLGAGAVQTVRGWGYRWGG